MKTTQEHDRSQRMPHFHNCKLKDLMQLFSKYQEEGFQPGGATLHSKMTPHGPDAECFEKASNAKLEPQRVADGTQVKH